jgi:long-chain acyl-CoA synthetase
MSETIEAVPPPTQDRGTLLDLFLRNVETFPEVGAIVDGDTRLTWGEYGRLSAEIALAMRELGVAKGDVVGIHAVNRHEHIVVDTAALRLGATPTSFYLTLAPDQLSYQAEDSAAKLVVCDADQLDVWLKIREELDALEHLVVLDDPEAEPGTPLPDGVLRWSDLHARGLVLRADGGERDLEAIRQDIGPDDPITIIYTSGTTGPPKGVLLTHRGLRFNIDASTSMLKDGIIEVGGKQFADWVVDGEARIPPGQQALSYLPLAHIAERFISHYSAFSLGTEITYVRRLEDLPEILPKVRPFVFPSVPRVWEKFHGAITARIEEEPNDRKRALGRKAIEIARIKGEAITKNRRADVRTEALYALFAKILYPRLREAMGLDRCVMGFSGAAPISPELLYTFTGLGIPISEAYGMTESSALITTTPPGKARVGTVGVPVPGVEVKIADDGEVVFRGENMTPGYLNRPDATAESIDEDGWFHTGDLGEFDSHGYLRIIGRKKELIITAAGKNLSPATIEETIKGASPLISQVCVIGDQRKFVSALIVLDGEALPAWCRSNDVPFESIAQASQHPRVRREIQEAVDQGNRQLARVEQIKRFAILGEEWTPESAELTPTMKLKRRAIHERHADVIERLYADEPGEDVLEPLPATTRAS